MKTITLAIILCLVFTVGCSVQNTVQDTRSTTTNTQDTNPTPIDSFTVRYFSRDISSGGTRIWNVTYTVRDGEIVSCDGNYTAEMRDGTTSTPCDVERLKSENSFSEGNYGVAINLTTSILPGEPTSGKYHYGPYSYSWEIIK